MKDNYRARWAATLAFHKYEANSLVGRCRSDSETGHVLHAVVEHSRGLGRVAALCGATPGRTSNGWGSWPQAVDKVNCSRCAKRLAALRLIRLSPPTA